MSSRGATV